MKDTPPASSSLVTPAALARLGSLEVRARTIVEGFLAGQHRSPFHGHSAEFAEHRAYVPGDALRHLDWKVLARTDRLVVRRFEEETNLRHLALVDTSGSMRYAGAGPVTKLAYAAHLAAALHLLLLRQRDATGLAAFDAAVHAYVPPRATLAHLQPLFHVLSGYADLPAPPPSDTAPGARTAAAQSLVEVAGRLRRRALVTVMTDLVETEGEAGALPQALRLLRARGHEVVVFQVLDAATERDFAFADRPTTFVDAETGERLTTHPADIRAAYRAAASAHAKEIRALCAEHAIDVVPLTTATPFDAGLAAYLRARRRVG